MALLKLLNKTRCSRKEKLEEVKSESIDKVCNKHILKNVVQMVILPTPGNILRGSSNIKYCNDLKKTKNLDILGENQNKEN